MSLRNIEQSWNRPEYSLTHFLSILFTNIIKYKFILSLDYPDNFHSNIFLFHIIYTNLILKLFRLFIIYKYACRLYSTTSTRIICSISKCLCHCLLFLFAFCYTYYVYIKSKSNTKLVILIQIILKILTRLIFFNLRHIFLFFLRPGFILDSPVVFAVLLLLLLLVGINETKKLLSFFTFSTYHYCFYFVLNINILYIYNGLLSLLLSFNCFYEKRCCIVPLRGYIVKNGF